VTSIDPADAPIGPAAVELGPWQRRLANFHRIAGGFMILKGLLHWATLFGLDGSDFMREAVEAQSSVVFFAIVDLAAGVALLEREDRGPSITVCFPHHGRIRSAAWKAIRSAKPLTAGRCRRY